jgi:hypothetical protein
MIEVKQPEIIVAPDTLEFGHLRSGHETRTRTVTIANGGTADLVIDRLDIQGDNYAVDESGFTVESGTYYQIEVTYDPKTFEHNEGYLDIYVEGDEEPSEGVWLDGNGDAPVINVSPTNHDFGSPLLGCDTTKEIIIQNDGNIDLVIDDVDVMASVPPDITIDFGTLPEFPWILAPNARLAFFTNYIPLDEQDDVTTFDISSNDPLTSIVPASAIGAAVLSNETVQTWIQKNQVTVDIIWIIDNSGSMNSYQNLLGSNMDIFMQMFLNYSPDFRMAFITTDNPTFQNGTVIDNNSIDPLGEAIDIIDNIGIWGSGWEKGLEMFKECLENGECGNMARRDATLVAIFMSDEPDNSGLIMRDLYATIDSIRPLGTFVPYAIIGDVPGGCNTHPHWAQPGYGYHDLVQQYASHWWSICDNNWGTQLEELAQNISVQTVFDLDSEDPHVDTIKVYVNGQTQTAGWVYDPTLNAVVFDLEEAPQPGDTVDIAYSTWGCGEE